MHVCTYKKVGSPHGRGRSNHCLGQTAHRHTTHELRRTLTYPSFHGFAAEIINSWDKWGQGPHRNGLVRMRKKLRREEEGILPQVVLNDNLKEVKSTYWTAFGSMPDAGRHLSEKTKAVRTASLGKIEETSMGKTNTKRGLKASQKGPMAQKTLSCREQLESEDAQVGQSSPKKEMRACNIKSSYTVFFKMSLIQLWVNLISFFEHRQYNVHALLMNIAFKENVAAKFSGMWS